MRLKKIRISNFKSFGSQATQISFDYLNYLIGANGSGKTVVLEALSRMFGFDPEHRKVHPTDFHQSASEPCSLGEPLNFWIECDFGLPEIELGNDDELISVPPNFRHLRIDAGDGTLIVRFRLEAILHPDGEVDSTLFNVLEVNEDGSPRDKSVTRHSDRRHIQVHYLPARRNPNSQINYTTKSLVGSILRSGEWEESRNQVAALSDSIGEIISGNQAVSRLSSKISEKWQDLHTSPFFRDPSVSFSSNDLSTLLRLIRVQFTPAPNAENVDVSRLSDGEKSLFYITLIFAVYRLTQEVLNGDASGYNLARWAPPVFTLIAIEEPENSLAPHYLGRVLKALEAPFADGAEHCHDLQVLVATHSPSVLSRVPPERIRHMRLNPSRITEVNQIRLPRGADDSAKFVREAVLSFPELYFARLVVLGEGDSEQIILKRALEAEGLNPDRCGIAIVPLGGRHVNHFWRLLHDLEIPHITLLDLDLGRFQGGWGRIRYAARQLEQIGCEFEGDEIDELPTWRDEIVFEEVGEELGWIEWLEEKGVYFSAPLDIDFSMMAAFPSEYGVINEELAAPSENVIHSVLGKKGMTDLHSDLDQQFFQNYHRRFKLGSKPTSHISALANISSDQIVNDGPASLLRLISGVRKKLNTLNDNES